MFFFKSPFYLIFELGFSHLELKLSWPFSENCMYIKHIEGSIFDGLTLFPILEGEIPCHPLGNVLSPSPIPSIPRSLLPVFPFTQDGRQGPREQNLQPQPTESTLWKTSPALYFCPKNDATWHDLLFISFYNEDCFLERYSRIILQIEVDIFSSSYPHFPPPHLEKKGRLHQSGSMSFFFIDL